jgi:NAD(P)-dependent dehydrogenase (short-subunit alcohol dehydrogenase family)
MNLQGKTAIVTGGERGIGLGIVRKLLASGMNVCIAGTDTESAEQALREVISAGSLIFVETDVREEAAVRKAVEKTVDTFGTLDALIANAGIANPGRTPVEELSLEEWNTYLATNLTGPFLCAKHALPALKAAGGAIVIIASTRAFQSEPDTPAYAATKGGLVALTHALAVSTGPEVRVNVISPGFIYPHDPAKLRPIEHSQHPVGRAGQPGDIASLTAFLISDEAGFITGENIIVDGGMSKCMLYPSEIEGPDA